MIMYRRIVFFIAFLSFFFCWLQPSWAAETDRYGQWQSPDSKLETMIEALDRLIGEGARAKAAHPAFLQDLQRVVDQYRTPRRTVLFSDDFSDHDFLKNPVWTVNRGEYTIDRYGSLYSSIAVKRSAPASGTGSGEDQTMRLLFGVLQELTKEEKAQQQAEPEQAAISSSITIPNNFNLQFTFRSDANWGSTSIGLIQGSDPASGYHLVYQASPLEGRPLELVKYMRGKPYPVVDAGGNTPNLDDGLDHVVLFSRSATGEMVVTVDGNEVLRAADLSYNQDFSGVAIINNGGSYGFDNIEIYTEK